MKKIILVLSVLILFSCSERKFVGKPVEVGIYFDSSESKYKSNYYVVFKYEFTDSSSMERGSVLIKQPCTFEEFESRRVAGVKRYWKDIDERVLNF
jgi:hypothetical protein